MTLGKKTLALFLLLGCAICLGSYIALRFTVLPTFGDFERRASEEALGRVSRMLEAELRALEIMNLEYSAWNDTYRYARGEFPEYEDENLDPGYWHSVNINMMLIFDAQGRPLYGMVGDPANGTRLPFTDDLLETLEPGHPLVTHESISSAVTGLFRTSAGIMQIASFPILTGQRTGPIAGSFIVGQFFTDEQVAEIGQRATVELLIHPMGDNTLPAHISEAFGDTGHPEVDNAIATNTETVHGYKVLADILGQPAAVLEVRQPRTITQIGVTTIRTAMTVLVLGSVGFLLAALFFLQRLIVGPIHMLTEKILDMQNTGNLEMDVETHRSDEVGVLAGKFAELTAGLRKARHELEDARDKALSMSDAKSEFLARMSHEIRTPMNGVLGMTELLRNTKLNGKQARFARTIYESAESLLHIINDILDISKIEAGKVELDIAPFNVRDVVEECLDLLAESAHQKNVELVGAIPGDAHTFVEGDALRLRQVLVNLLSNAVKFTEQGEIIVRLSAQEQQHDTIKYRFEVQDTGIGINARNLAKVFEPFTQEDGSTTRRYGGTGLGLAISRQLIELMGGEIGAESICGEGSTFWFTVPLRKDMAESALMQPGILTGKRVLIVDDNATNRETLCHQLEGWAMEAEAAGSGPEALGLLCRETNGATRFELILLDMHMPGMDGIQLATEIRETAGYENTPLLMLSSVSGADVGDDRNSVGIDAWLTKPVRQARLYDALVSHLSRAETRSARTRSPVQTVHATNDNANRNLHILLAEDNQVNQIVATGMLTELGHRVTVVADGIEAVSAVKRQDFDLVLMDCQMPGLDGYKATRAIRQWEVDQNRRPALIMALTANALSGDKERCLDAGMNDYVSKPFTLTTLGSTIARNIQRHDARYLANPAGPGPRILVVDDNSINQQVTKAMLDEFGYCAQIVSDGDEALEAMRASQFDLILMDCHMPVRDGYDTTREIRRLEYKAANGSRVPVVAVTADLMQSNRELCLDCGMDDYISKPFTQEQLRIVVGRWLSSVSAAEYEEAFAVDSDGFTKLASSTALASFDSAALDEIIRLDSSPGKNLVREIVVSYCALSTKLMLQLRAAVADRDKEEIEVLAHSLKGSSGQVGARLLAALCEQLIHGVKKHDLSNADVLCERAAAEHSAVIVALDKELQRIAA
jgi:CheY-like chemotaxis protein/signal transduction histidine kinase/HPt (histidine-containing phosphotransfer) domain-containing protein